MKKVYLNPLTVYDFLYEKIDNCDDLELIGNDKKAFNIINKLIKIREISVDKNFYDPNNIVIHKADIYLNNSSIFLGVYFVDGTGFDFSEEIQEVKDCLKDDITEFDLTDTLFLEPENWFLIVPAIEPNHQYDIIVFNDILLSALDNYKPIHLENGKLSKSYREFDANNYVLGNLGLVIPRFIVERILELSANDIVYGMNYLSTRFDYDLYLLQLVAYFKYLQKVHGWNVVDTKKFLLQYTIDFKHPSILFDVDYKELVDHRKLVKVIGDVVNIDDEIKKSYIDYSILLYDTCNLNNSKNNIKLVK